MVFSDTNGREVHFAVELTKMFGRASIHMYTLTWRRNLLAINVSGETSDWLQVGQMCSSDSNKLDRIPAETVNTVKIDSTSRLNK